MIQKTTLLTKEIYSQPKVNDFLESVARNSIKSKIIYGVALSHFQTFLSKKYGQGETLETIIESILSKELNLYSLLDNFVSYLLTPNRPNKLSSNSVALYVAAMRSYLQYYDVDIVPSKFKRRVRLPKNHREDEEPLDASDIRKLLLSCNNRRLKSYLLVLASGGMRTVEGLAIRIKDIDFSVSPTRVHIRKEYAKTRVARDIYISDEATKFLKEWIAFRYRDRKSSPTPEMKQDDLVFSRLYFKDSVLVKPTTIYNQICQEFHSLLKTVRRDEFKEGMNRRKFTLHSFRRFTKSVITTQTNTDYSEWFLGHAKSSYWTLKEPERREIYNTKCKYVLTFLDYGALENTSKGIVSQLEQKDREIAYLRERDQKHEMEMKAINDRMAKLDGMLNKIDKLEKEVGIKFSS